MNTSVDIQVGREFYQNIIGSVDKVIQHWKDNNIITHIIDSELCVVSEVKIRLYLMLLIIDFINDFQQLPEENYPRMNEQFTTKIASYVIESRIKCQCPACIKPMPMPRVPRVPPPAMQESFQPRPTPPRPPRY